jgi:hypothetical protein
MSHRGRGADKPRMGSRHNERPEYPCHCAIHQVAPTAAASPGEPRHDKCFLVTAGVTEPPQK